MNPFAHGLVVDWLQKRSLLSPHRVALIDAATGEEITYTQWNDRANQVANMLHHLGLSKGDRVAILATNCIEYLDLLFACQKTGIILQSLNWRLQPGELARLVEAVEPRLLVYTPDQAEKVRVITSQTRIARCLALGPGCIDQHQCWQDLIAHTATTAPRAVPLTMDDPWVLCYTGGTTGLPKAAILTHGTITWNSINTIASWGLTPDSRTFLNMPLFHTGGINVFTLPLVHVGGCSIVCKCFDVDQVFDLIEYGGVNIFFAVPTMFIVMQQHPRWHDSDFSQCQTVLSGGAPCPMPVFERFFEKGVAFKTGYGLTEAGPNNFALPDADVQRKAGSVGFPLFHVDVAIVNDAGQPCQPDELGELLLRGPHVISGYWNNPPDTAKAIRDGWLHTGDLARRDAEGYIFIVGRVKDMIISGGENIYPAEVESVMLGHDAVAEVALIGVPDTKWGEVGRAIVVLRPGMEVKAHELISYTRQHIAHYKVPRSIVFVSSIPKTGAGKVDKQSLQQQYGYEVVLTEQ
ncbi:MAG: long-chain fatty acid--CoA ligase [Chloroflexaceae bacterium]|nr:long-chain fatty acid--CoA ligase [Chloroflexaceae bacterium]